MTMHSQPAEDEATVLHKRAKASAPLVKPVAKSAEAYRTIAEAAAELGVATHVLRFWESKFPALQPLKQQGGRRFYKPADMALLRRIQELLYREGYTIRGVQAALKKPTHNVQPMVLAPRSAPVVTLQPEAVGQLAAEERLAVVQELRAIAALLRDEAPREAQP